MFKLPFQSDAPHNPYIEDEIYQFEITTMLDIKKI